jgi:hypothetical protein
MDVRRSVAPEKFADATDLRERPAELPEYQDNDNDEKDKA